MDAAPALSSLPPHVVVAAVVSLWPLLLLLAPSLIMNPLDIFIQTSGYNDMGGGGREERAGAASMEGAFDNNDIYGDNASG